MKGKVGSELMKQHKSYWPIIRRMMDAEAVSAMATSPAAASPKTFRGCCPRAWPPWSNW